MNAYSPRRQSERWLDGDCPHGVLAIYRDRRESLEPYTVFYAALQTHRTGHPSLVYIGLTEAGAWSHGEMPAYAAAEYRFRNAHRACKWTELPEAVRNTIRNDLKEENE
jgi:hypothetical protein